MQAWKDGLWKSSAATGWFTVPHDPVQSFDKLRSVFQTLKKQP